jgi:Flp pilus assembly protein TadD/uncharacterized protein (AIM24 family)
MPESSPRAPFDQGLFLTHLNKGKAHFDERRYEEAERELEEAYLLRPRDQKVLNLLGLVYFKQEKYEKAEEIYRKLVTESPEAHTLFYNLGLIHYKLNRLEEAETTFLKALELGQENPKINFYLGSIYERMKRFQDAIFQYRQAGANLLVRRVEDKLAAGDGPLAVEKDDTAEFKAQEIRDAIKRVDALVAAKTIQPVSGAILAADAPRRADESSTTLPGNTQSPAAPKRNPRDTQPGLTKNATLPAGATLPPDKVRTDTAKFRIPGGGAPPASSGRLPEVISFPRMSPAERPGGADGDPATTIPPRRANETFRFLENNLMEVEFSGKVFIKQGTIYSYGGNLTFWVKDKRPGGQPALVIITGTGKVILHDKDRQITFMRVENETLYVEPSHLLACEETLTPRYIPVGELSSGLEILALEGQGMVALSVASKPLPLSVTPELPVSVPSASIITWSGGLTPKVVEDRQLYEVVLSGADRAGVLIRLEGTGRVLVEQAR